MITMVVSIISSLKPLHTLLLFFYVIIIYKTHASTGVVILILHDAGTSNESVKSLNTCLTFEWQMYNDIYNDKLS